MKNDYALILSPNSTELKSKASEEALSTEMDTHEKKGTWHLNSAQELADVIEESRTTDIDVIPGGVPNIRSQGH